MTTNPWDRRPTIQSKGDTRKASTYRSVGAALSNWEFYEFSLVLVFRCIINADWDGPVEDAFGSILAHKGRVEMLQAAAKMYFHRHDSNLKGSLKILLDKAIKLCARRNEIAHGQVTRFKDANGQRPGWFLLPSYFAANKHEILGITSVELKKLGLSRPRAKRRPLYAYTSKDIDHYAKEFWALAQEAGALAGSIIDQRMDAKMRALGKGQTELPQLLTELTSRKAQSSARA